MSCELQNRLFEYVDGSLDAITHGRVALHLETCPDCAALVASLDRTEPPDEGLTRTILSRTMQRACEQSAERIPDWVDGHLDALDAELVAGHVSHCDDCEALSSVMRRMTIDLPSLVEIEPDARFIDDVMAATVRKAPVLSWAARIDGWFNDLVRRPRIAWEGAYVASVFLALLVGFPGSPLAGVSQKAIELARTSPDAIEKPFVALEAGLNSAANGAWSSTRKAARSIAGKAAAESGDAYRKAKRDLGTLWTSIASETESLQKETQESTSTNGEDK